MKKLKLKKWVKVTIAIIVFMLFIFAFYKHYTYAVKQSVSDGNSISYWEEKLK